MSRNLVLMIIVAALALPGAALAANKPAKYKVGQACSAKKEATYAKNHFTCVSGHLKAKK